jgi:hypothetical protein
MRNFVREIVQNYISEESKWRQNDNIKRDLKMMCCEDGRLINLELGFLLQIASF